MFPLFFPCFKLYYSNNVCVTFVACLLFQGTNASALEKDIGPEQFPINEHYFGLVNVSSAASSHALTAFIDRTTKQWCHLSKQTSPGVSEPPPARRSSRDVFLIFNTFSLTGHVSRGFPLRVLLPPQFGNTCYCNSVLQALYFCRPFRENVLAYKAQQKKKENLLTCLADLFHSIATQKKKVGVIPPKKFISRLRKENGESRESSGPTAAAFPNV